MNAKQKKAFEAAMKQLPAIAEATAQNEGAGFTFTKPEIHKPLIEAGLVVINESMTGEGGVATRCTEDGMKKAEELKAAAANGDAATETEEPLTFAIAADVPLPEVVKGGAIRKSQYPFDQLAVKASFFVPATAKMPNPAKSLASSVTGAMKRHAIKMVDGEGKPVMVKNRKNNEVQALRFTRVFTIRAIEDGTPWGEQFKGVKGAAIWREADKVYANATDHEGADATE